MNFYLMIQRPVFLLKLNNNLRHLPVWRHAVSCCLHAASNYWTTF